MNTTKRVIKYRGELELSGSKLLCYVLEDGTRILSRRGIQSALKMVDESNGQQSPGTRLDRYLNQKSLQPYIYKGKRPDHFNPIICYDENNVEIMVMKQPN